jgi:hypothetical protein
MRITAACPEAMIPDANHLAMALAFSVADGQTYNTPSWKDAQGNLYAAASWMATLEWITFSQQPIQRPDWDTEHLIDLEAATRAQQAIRLLTEPAPATPTHITCIINSDGVQALQAMGLTLVDLSEQPD